MKHFIYAYDVISLNKMATVFISFFCVFLPPAVFWPLYRYGKLERLDRWRGDDEELTKTVVMAFAIGLPTFWVVTCFIFQFVNILPNSARRAAPIVFLWATFFVFIPIAGGAATLFPDQHTGIL